MTSAFDIPEAIQWHEGMLLAPQHLQQLALRQELLLQYQLSTATPYFWGVRELDVDPDALVEGQFVVRRLEALLPDGLVVAYPQNGSPPLRLDLSADAEAMRGEPMAVSLAAVAATRGASSVRGTDPRYDSVEGGTVVDENTGEGELRIPRLRPRPRLVLGQVPNRLVGMPLARVTFSNNVFQLVPYAPPSTAVAPGSLLGSLVGGLAAKLREKALALTERQQASEGSAQLGSVRQLIHRLSGALPPFEAAIATGATHPYPLYIQLCALMGQVASIGHDVLPPAPPVYDHADPYRAYREVADRIEKALAEGIVESHRSYRFEERSQKSVYYFQRSLERPWLRRPLVLGVRSRSTVGAEATAEWINESLIGSRSKIGDLRQKRIRGLERRAVERTGDLAASRGVLLFELTMDEQFVDVEEELVVVNLDDPGGAVRPQEIVLYVPNEAG